MERINQLKQEMADYLRMQQEAAGVKVMTAFPGARRDDPLPCPALVVGVDSVEVAPAGLGGYLGDRADSSLHGGTAVITLRFDLYAPPEQGGAALTSLYEMLCDCLVLHRSPFGVEKVSAGATGYDGTAAANHMTATALLRTALIHSDSTVPIESFRVRRTDGATQKRKKE